MFLLFLIMCVCVCMWLCAREHRLLRGQKLKMPRARVTGGCELLTWVLGTKLRTFGRAASAPNLRTISLVFCLFILNTFSDRNLKYFFETKEWEKYQLNCLNIRNRQWQEKHPARVRVDRSRHCDYEQNLTLRLSGTCER